jgi:hypothetical protein
MIKVLKFLDGNIQNKENFSSMLSICKKSKIIQKKDKNVLEVKNEDRKQSHVWSIDSILSNIFAYSNQKDLVKFNTVCKKWNHLTNHIIHKTIRLNSSLNKTRKTRYMRFIQLAENNRDVIECIANNAKNAPFVKDFHYKYDLEPRRAIEFFDTFRFISNLTIKDCKMSQDQFLGMISPLTQLQELNLINLQIKRIVYKRLYKEFVQLPSSLKKLRLSRFILINNPDLFIKTINSHSSLVEFSNLPWGDEKYLEPFYKPYPNLLKFEYTNFSHQSPQPLMRIFEQNHQLNSLKLSLNCWNNGLISCISSQLSNLEEFDMCSYPNRYDDFTELNSGFSQNTKIKKLNLSWFRLSNTSIDSILLNCPHLEELTLNRGRKYHQPDSKVILNICKFNKIKKLNINCENLNVAVLGNLLLSCPHLSELVVNLPVQCREFVKEICEKSLNLLRLEICPPSELYGRQRDIFFQEFYSSGFFINSSKLKSTLTHLTLSRFSAQYSKAEDFKNFKRLKSIKFKEQFYHGYRKFGKKYKIYMRLWPGYRLLSSENILQYDLEFKKNSC